MPQEPVSPTQVRADRWLWAVRVYKTRSMATEACRGGHVRVNGSPAKPSAPVRVGDRVTARAGRERVLEVVRLIEVRVSAPIAAECFIDQSPPPVPREMAAPAFLRDPATGRPTKRERRRLDQVRGGSSRRRGAS